MLGDYAPLGPQVFREYLISGGVQRRRFWYTCLYIFSGHVIKTSDPGHQRSGHQVTSSDLTPEKSLNAHFSYTGCPIPLKLSAIDIRTSIYRLHISEFRYT